MKVIIAEPNDRYSVTSAETYGELLYLSKDGTNPFDSSNTIREFMIRLKEIKFDPEEDFICMTGNAITVALLLSAVTAMFTKFKVLMFDARVSAYKERVILIKRGSDG